MAFENLALEVAKQCGNHTEKPNNSWYNCSCPNTSAHKEGDKHASGGIKNGDAPGWIFVSCQVCKDTEQIYRSLEASGVYKRPPKGNVVGFNKRGRPKKQPLAAYDYYDETDENLLFQVRKWPRAEGGKYFTQHKWDGTEFREKREDARLVLWHLKSVLAATKCEDVSRRDLVFLCEGEKDVLTLESFGLTATTNPGGAGKWDDSYTEALKGAARVFMMPDNDDAGENHVLLVAPKLLDAGIPVTVVRLPDLPHKGDVTDYVQSGKTFDDLLDECYKAPDYVKPAGFVGIEPPRGSEREPEDIEYADEEELPLGYEFNQPKYLKALELLNVGEYPDGDDSNGRRMVNQCGDKVRHATEGLWLGYSGGVWFFDNKSKTFIKRCAKEVIRKIRHEAEVIGTLSRKLRNKLIRWADKCNKEGGKVSAMVESASSEQEIQCSILDFDTDIFLLNCKNKILDLKKSELKEHDPKFLCTKQTSCEFNPNADYKLWLDFLLTAMGGDMEMVNFLARAVGLSLCGDIKEQTAFFLYGPGGNGKSIFLGRILKMLGSYAISVRSKMFMVTQNESQTDNPGRLKGARFVAVSEIRKNDNLDESLLKDVTGDDEVTGRYLYSEPFDFWPNCKLWFRGNFLPSVNDPTESIWRRILIVPFSVKLKGKQISEDNDDDDCDLARTLDQFHEGILFWAYLGFQDYLKQGLNPPEKVRVATAEYRADQDKIGRFVERDLTFSRYASIAARALYEAYKERCEADGSKAESETKFGREFKQRPELAENGVKVERTKAGYFYRGVGLFSEHGENEETAQSA